MFDRGYRPHIPDNLIAHGGGQGNQVFFHPKAMRAIIDGLIEAEREKARLIGDDGLLIGGDSADPTMQRLRLAKAQLAEHELASKRAQVVPIDSAMRALSIVATRLRRMGERLTKRHGREVADEIDRTLTESQAELEAAFSDGSSNDHRNDQS
jgi:phage terminase Nu1 subunit (DNA packaging protein)